MTNPTFKFLRGKTLYTSLSAAKTALENKVKNLQQGEPALVYYTNGEETTESPKTHLALFGIGGTGNENATGTGIFYNTIEVDSAIAALGAQISGSTEDNIEKGLTLYALKNYIESKAGAATTTVVSGNGISVTETTDDTTKAKTYTVAANVELQYVAAVTEKGKESGAKIKLLDKSNPNNTAFGTIEVSDIIGNGLLQSTSYDKDTGKLTLKFLTASGTTQDTVVDLGALIDINDVGISAASQDYLSVTLNAGAAESGGSQAVFAALVQDVSANTNGLADAKDVKTYVDNKIAGLDATATSTDSAVATVKVGTKGGNVTAVTVTNKSAGVSSGTTDNVTLTATTDTAAVLGSDIPTIKSYVDAKVSGKNVTATGDTYVSATAENNEVTITTNVSGFTVTTTGTSESTITGATDKLVSAANIASGITTFTNARISEEIAKLDKAETAVTGTNVSFKYSQADAIVTISDLTVDYTTVNYTGHTGDTASAQTASITITDGEKIAKGKDVSAATEYAKALYGEGKAYTDAKIETLDATKKVENTIAANGNNLTIEIVEANGLITGLTASITTLDAGTFE